MRACANGEFDIGNACLGTEEDLDVGVRFRRVGRCRRCSFLLRKCNRRGLAIQPDDIS